MDVLAKKILDNILEKNKKDFKLNVSQNKNLSRDEENLLLDILRKDKNLIFDNRTKTSTENNFKVVSLESLIND